MLAEYAIAGGGNLNDFLRDLTANPWMVAGIVAAMVLIYLFTTRS